MGNVALLTKDKCWLWANSNRGSRGHGKFTVDGISYQAHRVMYENIIGKVPEGTELDHLCENPPCINPDHLEPVTHQENTLRYYRRRTHCRNGHPYSEYGRVHLKKGNISKSNPTGKSRECVLCHNGNK